MPTDKLNLIFDATRFAAEFHLASNGSASPQAQLDAMMWLQGNVGSAGGAFPRGRGQMNFQGGNYLFRVSGLCMEEAGTASIYATGRVIGLRNVADVGGNYRASGPRGAIADGATCLRNERGVVIQLVATDASTAARRSVSALRMRLDYQT
jgi:hypothetical protein